MEEKECIKYESESFGFTIYLGSFVTFLGNGNKKLSESFMFRKKEENIFINDICSCDINLFKIRRNISYVLNKDLDVFVTETVEDEIAFGLEGLAKTKPQMKKMVETKAKEFGLTEVLKRSPMSLGSSDKAKLKILSAIIFKPRVLILNNILSELDNNDKIKVSDLLRDYAGEFNIVLNFTEEVEETLFGDRIIITDENRVIADGSTMAILNEEKLMKKLGFGLPFMVELNKYLMDYEIIKKYELNMSKLVNEIWK